MGENGINGNGHLPIHELATMFPLMGPEEYAGFKADIKANGIHQAVAVWRGALIDGRHRYQACQDLGVDPPIRYRDDDADPVAFVLSANMSRRQLTGSQKVIITAQLPRLERGNNQYNLESKSDNVDGNSVPIQRETLASKGDKFAGPVEVDETYIGGKAADKHSNKKLRAGRGTVCKAAVVGMKDRDTNQVTAEVVDSTDAPTLQAFVRQNTGPDTQVYTDEARAYEGLSRPHEAVKHSAKEYVKGMAHTNGIESHWAMLKRGHDGVYQHLSRKHLGRYVNEFAGRHNNRPLNTEEQMSKLVQGAEGKRLTYATLIGPVETRQPTML